MNVVEWVDQRLDLSEVRHFVAEKGVPVHAQKIWYYLGGMTLFLFGVQVSTGILLLLYYRPSSTEAYESVQFIVTQVPFGWLIRNETIGWSSVVAMAVILGGVALVKDGSRPRVVVEPAETSKAPA